MEKAAARRRGGNWNFSELKDSRVTFFDFQAFVVQNIYTSSETVPSGFYHCL